MAPKFGTSGLRGLVSDLTDDLVARHVVAFAQACRTDGRLFVGRDLRASSPRITAAVLRAGQAAGLEVTGCGRVPTPALALAAQQAGAAAVMVTGSHIPDDRNGLKFYTPAGEISKVDETAILEALPGIRVGAGTGSGGEGAAREGSGGTADGGAGGADAQEARTLALYRERYVRAFGPDALAGLGLGLYQHSTVARDLFAEVLEALGARVTALDRSDHFIPLDTEAVPEATRARLRDHAAAQDLFSIVSADGDGDRPLLTNAAGGVVPGDVLGLITARILGADRVVTPVSSTTAIEASGAFAKVRRTRIGSPFVVAGIEEELAGDAAARPAGFEANGGLLLGFEARLPGGALASLMTRDALLPLLAVLMEAKAAGGVAALCAALPARVTAADRLQDADPVRVAALMERLTEDAAARRDFLGDDEIGLDLTDGLRMRLSGDRILHLRPSGNAPELRCYAEAGDAHEAKALVVRGLAAARQALA